MPTASALRNQLEAALADKIPAALSPVIRGARSVTATGLGALDAMLEGGFPAASITELVGGPCSGRTSAAVACISSITQGGNVCAWIDVADAMDPESVAANGVDLEKLLWVRCGAPPRAAAPVGHEAGPGAEAVHGLSTAQPRHMGSGSPHPRSEGRDMPEAIASMMQAHGGIYDRHERREKKAVGTPGNPNRPLSPSSSSQRPLPRRSGEREEQVNSDRLPPRRGENLALAPRCAEPLPRRVASVPSGDRMPVKSAPAVAGKTAGSAWQALDQALRAADLLLQGGGFSAIVLDLGSTPPEIAWRIPLATWFRFRAACERTRVSLVLLTQHPCARSAAELVVRLETGGMTAESQVMTGVRYRAAKERSRAAEHDRVVSIRKPPRADTGQWTSEAAWAQAK